jgi:hypothetical protein
MGNMGNVTYKDYRCYYHTMTPKSLRNKTLRQIVIDENNYNSLKLLGNAGESFNDVLTKILTHNHRTSFSKNTILENSK